jgi:predicted secreted hydrolase
MRPRTAAALLILAAATLLAAYLLARPEPLLNPKASLSIAETLRAPSAAGYARAIEPREFRFPADHGPHPEFRTEWWYYTGNLETAEGRRFGFQLTFFRSALSPKMPARQSAWATRQAWLAHFAVSDLGGAGGGHFHSFERWSRGAIGLAGARAEPFRVWVKDWAAEGVGGQAPPMHLTASEGDLGIDLVLQQGKPPVLQGDRGLSQKGSEIGNASYYYSLTRMPAAGTLRLGSERFAVTGLAWMDREWSTSSLSPGQAGWDWFALQLSDGSDLMLYRLRRNDGSADLASSGTVVSPGGEARHLVFPDFQIAGSGEWRSPRSGARYPGQWRVQIPSEELDLEIRPALADQELDVSFRYWEGTVEIAGIRRGLPVSGRGYAELTGYAPTEHR